MNTIDAQPCPLPEPPPYEVWAVAHYDLDWGWITNAGFRSEADADRHIRCCQAQGYHVLKFRLSNKELGGKT